MRCIEQCLGQLPAETRSILLAYYDAGSGQQARKELASRLGLTPGALKVRVFRARVQLEARVRRCLEGDAPD